MKTKQVNIVLTAILTASLSFIAIRTSSSGEYDPWIDSNDDGEIDIFDAISLASAFGTSGTPINKTALLLELQTTINELNATVVALEQTVSDLEGQPSEKTLAHAVLLEPAQMVAVMLLLPILEASSQLHPVYQSLHSSTVLELPRWAT